ncbi:HAMP domain-containing histidine kinase [Roseomonas sp. NAR14]|uniref:histidine kinase n=1 Tax=Roseomonas acroporae TaxID=2937791 RepID=A0A9X2BUU5_9PROT|nr:HAMP domain-containing sensor histidine kinase [Roseomonas acroporae]MCK8785983.1 HAMP domain-containing histidine kinase [Roseomonas acroporae]
MPENPVFLAVCALVLSLLAGACLHYRRRLRHCEAALAEARRGLAAGGRCLGLVARELRVPAFGMLGHAERLGAQSPEAAPEAVSVGALAIAAMARELLRLTEDVADLAAAEAGPGVVAPEAFPVAPLLREVTETVGSLLGPACRHWRIARELEVATLHADRRALHGVLSHVLTRAARLSRDGDFIALRLLRTADTVSLIVEDEGMGAGAGDLAVDAAAGDEAMRTRGMGFGLAMAQRLMRAHGGELRLEAVPGVGTRTWLTLPGTCLVEARPLPARPSVGALVAAPG